jgi:hypothetical protein
MLIYLLTVTLSLMARLLEIEFKGNILVGERTTIMAWRSAKEQDWTMSKAVLADHIKPMVCEVRRRLLGRRI